MPLTRQMVTRRGNLEFQQAQKDRWNFDKCKSIPGEWNSRIKELTKKSIGHIKNRAKRLEFMKVFSK